MKLHYENIDSDTKVLYINNKIIGVQIKDSLYGRTQLNNKEKDIYERYICQQDIINHKELPEPIFNSYLSRIIRLKHI